MSTTRRDRRRALALRAFPPRWRERHGAELLYLSSELAAAPDHDADWREFVDIVRGGLAVRFEDRPPLRARVAYKWTEKPVPMRWHAWMRDDLRGRFLGYRRNLRVMFPVWIVAFVLPFLNGWPNAGPGPFFTGAALLTPFIAMGPGQARRLRTRMNAKVGYDIVAAGPLPPPRPLPTPVLLRPATRAPYVRYAIPFAVWSSISGNALIAGAAITNAPDRSIGPVAFSPDPNSPLTVQQVAAIGLGVALAAILVAAATATVTRVRVRSLEATTAHESLPLRARDMWFAATSAGVLVTLIGALGVMPDMACAAIGAVMVVSGAGVGSAAFVVARRDAELGRHISLAELLVGERHPSDTGLRQPARDSGH